MDSFGYEEISAAIGDELLMPNKLVFVFFVLSRNTSGKSQRLSLAVRLVKYKSSRYFRNKKSCGKCKFCRSPWEDEYL